jgi:asparagine synthase (glutamine-hydrolysing)
MCGITGIYALKPEAKRYFENAEIALKTLSLRGPDGNGIFKDAKAVLCHSRLAIIDTSDAASQPFSDSTGRFTIVFNGEIFNFKELRKSLETKYIFRSSSDTEVLLNLYVEFGKDCLAMLNGFFAFVIFDKQNNDLFLARDRFGVKPLLVYLDEEKLIFASEMKALLAWGIGREMDSASLTQYLQFNYTPGPNAIFKGVKKLEPGHFLVIKENQFYKGEYYQLPDSKNLNETFNYNTAQQQLISLLGDAVQKRLIADVPLGAFLSGGIDSSVIVALASRHTSNLNTFSIGFRDEPLFDETHYASLVAKKFKTNHTVFSLTNEDLFANLRAVLNYIDEPFADSSALNVHILSMHTRKHVTVALSGDGADEMLGGYNKHEALFRTAQGGFMNAILAKTAQIWKFLPKSRNGKPSNLFRQLEKYSTGINLPKDERYWQWASFLPEKEALRLTLQNDKEEYLVRKKYLLRRLTERSGMNEIFQTDMNLVLQNDMLVKVDLMSMANSLEVRTPFLDYRVVDFIFNLPSSFKIDSLGRKKILRDAFRNVLPAELYSRPKQGFEVPLLKWFQTDLKATITEDLLAANFLKDQGIFDPELVKGILQRLFSNNPGDAATHVWNLIVFQHWWRKYGQPNG